MAGIGDLAALFDSVDGYVEDAKELGLAGASAIGATIIWGKASDVLFGYLPAGLVATRGFKPAVTAVAGIVGGSMVSRYNRTVGLGVGIGLVTSALIGAVKEFQLPIPGLAADMEFDGYLAGATTTLEPVAGFAGAPTTIESVAGFSSSPVTFEDAGRAPVGSFLT